MFSFSANSCRSHANAEGKNNNYRQSTEMHTEVDVHHNSPKKECAEIGGRVHYAPKVLQTQAVATGNHKKWAIFVRVSRRLCTAGS